MNRQESVRRAPAQDRRLKPRTAVLGALVLAGLCCGATLLWFVLSGLARQGTTLPRVFIDSPETGDEITVGAPALVYGRAVDPEGIVSIELWVNGQLTAIQSNDGSTPFDIRESWRPTDAGAYTLLIRAKDARGFVGQSPVILVNVREKTPPSPEAVSEIPSVSGEPAPGIPLAEDSPTADGALDDGDHPAVGIPDVPADVDRGGGEPRPYRPLLGALCTLAPAICAPSSTADAPSPDPEICLFLTGTTDCSAASRSGVVPPAAPRVLASYAGACTISVAWSDESDNESGFKLYRVPSGGSGELIALTASAGSGYADHLAGGGAYRYYVSAFNAEGESPSAPTAEIGVPASDCATAAVGETIGLELEALTFTVSEAMDRVYCYYSIADAPFVRVPADEAEFLDPIEGGWNIADYASGAERLGVVQRRDVPLNVGGHCLGWRGVELLDLGGFAQSHPPEEWDGRMLSNTGGQFTVTYSIHPPGDTAREGRSEAILNPSLRAPYNLRFQRLDACRGGGMDPVTCALEDTAMLHWDWELAPGDARSLIAFEVAYRIPGMFGRIGDAAVARQYYYTSDKRAPGVFTQPCIINTANPLEPIDLGPQRIPDTDFFGAPVLDYNMSGFVFTRDVYYSVRAVVGTPEGGAERSSWSEEHWVGLSGCSNILVVQLQDLEYGINPDALDPFSFGETPCEAEYRNTYDAADIYGWVSVAIDSYEDRVPGFKFWWNCPDCEHPGRMAADGPSGVRPPHDTGIEPAPGTLQWTNMALSVEGPGESSTGFSRNNTTIVMPLGSNADIVNLRVRFAFYDYDSGLFRDGDDLWCAADDLIQTRVGSPEAAGLHGFRVRSQRGEYCADYDIGCSVGIYTFSLPVTP